MTPVLLRAASWIVPSEARRDWLDEWRAELWHVRQIDPAQSMRFCLGAFRDAAWLRRHHPAPGFRLMDSPVHCLLVLAALAGLGFALRPVERVSERLIAIRPHGGNKALSFEQYREILRQAPRGFDSIAFYRPVKGGPSVATENIADVLRGSLLPGVARYVTVESPGPEPGLVVARSSSRPSDRPWHIRIPSQGGFVLLDCAPLAPRIPDMPVVIVMAASLTVLAGTTSFSLGAMPRRAWIFLALKLVLAISVVWFAAWLLPKPVIPQALIIGWVIAGRWALHDQRRRCPVCLRMVTKPVSYGCLSHVLLDWHGAEYICPEGHGLLQISATFASPYAAQQWVRL